MHFIFLHTPTKFLQLWHCDIVSDETQLFPHCSVCDLMIHSFRCHQDHLLEECIPPPPLFEWNLIPLTK